MSSLVVAEGDVLVFEPMFGSRQVVLTGLATMSGSGVATIGQRRVCVVGDEKSGRWPAQYFIPGYTPGAGFVSIETLDSSQMAPCVISTEPLIVMGQQFIARFTPTVPATLSSPPHTPDAIAPSMGRGCFMPLQTAVSAG
jgi:hypothetical protein